MNQTIGCLALLIILGLIVMIGIDDQYNLFHFTVVLLLALNFIKIEGINNDNRNI